jgi:hypothetical protein
MATPSVTRWLLLSLAAVPLACTLDKAGLAVSAHGGAGGATTVPITTPDGSDNSDLPLGTGGSRGTGGTGISTGAGGAVATGGSAPVGGTIGQGGVTSTSGTSPAGGQPGGPDASSTGGATGMGGEVGRIDGGPDGNSGRREVGPAGPEAGPR